MDDAIRFHAFELLSQHLLANVGNGTLKIRKKHDLVTGGTKGAGEAMVRRFVLSGAQVATAARSSLPKDQRPALFVQTDLGSSAGIKQLADRILSEWGGVDILVNCVGGSDAPNGGYAV